MAERYDYLFKFIIIGDAATGKSCLLHRFIDDKCKFTFSRPIANCEVKKESTHTIGVEFGSKIVEVGGQFVKLQIWVKYIIIDILILQGYRWSRAFQIRYP
jgi:GTPase SAR1 family protein